jgi:cytochrome c biogenesis protein CcdA
VSALWFGVATAFWLGLLTAVSPCPLATNIAAVSFLARRVDSPREVFLAGILYTLGRVLTYAVLGVLLATSALSAPGVSAALQSTVSRLLGPLLVLVGMILLGLLSLPSFGGGAFETLTRRAEEMGLFGALLLGVMFSLAFCPVSAALFFGSLLPLAVNAGSGLLLPAVYGVATGLPVLAFALLIAFGVKSLSGVFGRVTRIELWARRITGGIFIGVGLYKTLQDIFGLFV